MKKIARVGEISRFRRFDGKGGYCFSSPAPLSPPPPLPRGLPTASSPPNPCAVLHDFR
ncbi:hypothetical protein T4C_12421 [Trichinella pseudospiralis]|uniref:Uncharacterized protein n=1 Tax=Trichinella pseudospiralis TaxID=6337 RepID=A0A0V1GD62_TRIPS|nr:hypothetical protein T4C_12421 [Trichinella pseudospiralis]